RDREAVPGELALRFLQASRRELGGLTQIHRRLEPPQLDGDVAVRGGEIEDLRPRPRRTTQGREAEREALAARQPGRVSRGKGGGSSRDEFTAGRHRSTPCLSHNSGWRIGKFRATPFPVGSGRSVFHKSP